MIAVIIAVAVRLAAGIAENWFHQKALARIPLRILVNGTRGKTTVTRMTAAVLNEAGIQTYAKTTGSEARRILPDGRKKTGIGQFIRNTSIDEFPQFINVLLGDMSIVGPRPHMLKHTDEFTELVAGYMLRHQVKPGVTGWSQVNGYRGEIKKVEDIQNRVKFDLWYIDNWSFALDLRIIFKTIALCFGNDIHAL